MVSKAKGDDDDDDNDENEGSSLTGSSTTEKQGHDAGPEAAGIVRGISRSVRSFGKVGQSLLRSPIGRLPRQKLPLRQVAKVSDRVSQSYDVWSSAVESAEAPTISKMARFRTFAISVVKNSLLGTAVFEAYGIVVIKLAPPLPSSSSTSSEEEVQGEERATVLDEQEGDVDNEEEEELAPNIVMDDAYSRASLAAHYGAGFVAGSVHGVASSFLDRPNGITNFPRFCALNTLHHSLAHSMLFGSYVTTKRILIEQMHRVDPSTHSYGGGYLVVFGIAGGVAGQCQHVLSHYTEQLFGLTVEGTSSTTTTAAVGSNTTTTAIMRHRFRTLAAPTFRSTLGAFLPSAIGFIAFEYGRWLEQK